MATTNFETGTTIASTWLNDVDAHVYDQETIAHDSEHITYTAPGTGAVIRSVEEEFNDLTVSVKRFGAVGDGTTDDTAAIQAALDAGIGKTVCIPPGDYVVTSTLLIHPQTHFTGSVAGIGFNEGRGATLLVGFSFSGFILENSGITVSPSNPWAHGIRVEHIAFMQREATGVSPRTASGFNIGPCGDMSAIRHCKFYGLDIDLKVGGTVSPQGTQVSCNIDTISLYSSNTGLLFQNCNFTNGVRNIMIDGCVIPVHFKDCGATFHCNIDQWHAENLTTATEVFYVDNCSGSYHEIRAGSVEATTASATLSIVRITRTTAVNKARVKVANAYSTIGTNYILNDVDLGVSWTQSDLGLSYAEIAHNFPNVLSSGQGSTFYQANFVQNSKRESSTAIYRIESADTNFSHNIHQYSSGASAGVQIKDGLTPFTTQAQFRGNGTLSQWNLFTTAAAFTGTGPSVGGFIEQNTTEFHIGNRSNGRTAFWTNNTERGAFDSSGNFRPHVDNTYTLGTASLRWSVVYAGTGTINTSDERYKQKIQDIDSAVLRAWGKVKFYQYKFNDAVESKGDGARWHFGAIAQKVKEAFEFEGLDAFAYGILCYDEWPDEYEDVIGQREVEKFDENGVGTIETEDYVTGEKRLVRHAGNRYGIRYEEALALECSYLRSKIEGI